MPPQLESKLSAQESEFFSGYDRLLSDYMARYPALELATVSQVSVMAQA
jgi:hypothetical protein